MSIKPRVFLAELPNENIDSKPMLQFGEITIIMNKRGIPVADTAAFVAKMRDRLDELKYDPRIDYFCIVGPVVPVSCALAGLMVRYPNINVLLYNRHTQTYSPRSLDLRSMSVIDRAD